MIASIKNPLDEMIDKVEDMKKSDNFLAHSINSDSSKIHPRCVKEFKAH